MFRGHPFSRSEPEGSFRGKTTDYDGECLSQTTVPTVSLKEKLQNINISTYTGAHIRERFCLCW